MSLIYTEILRSEAAEMFAFPGELHSFQTHCDGQPKRFKEVLVHFDGVNWVEDPAFVSGQSKVALRVDNDCDATFAYLNMMFNDFRLEQLCCGSQGLLTEDGEGILAEDGELLIPE